MRKSVTTSKGLRGDVEMVDGPEGVGFLFFLPGEGQIGRAILTSNPDENIRDVFTMESHRRLGVATALLQALEARAKKDMMRKLLVLTGTGNLAARGLYEKLGYHNSGERTHPEIGPAIVFDKALK